MVTQDLLNYVQDSLKAGKNINDIQLELVTSGWQAEDIQEALQQVGGGSTAPVSSLPQSNTSGDSLPSIKILFQESWQLFRTTLVPFLKLFGLIAIGVVVVGVFIAVIMFLLSASGINLLKPNFYLGSISTTQIIVSIFTILLTLAGLVFFIFVITPMLQISYIMILNSNGKVPIRSIIKGSRSMAIPYFLTAVFSGLIIAGGIYALIIPGIYFSVIFSFVQYVFVLDGLKGKAALKRSYMMVKGRFWNVYFRIIAIAVIYYIIASVFQMISKQIPFFGIVSVVFDAFSGVFIACYTFLIYKHLKNLPLFSKPFSMKWIWITSGIGFVAIPILLTITLISINPNRQFAQANNTKRRSDTNAILSSISLYQQESTNGAVPWGYTTSPRKISKADVDLCSVITPKYISELPGDPKINNGSPVANCKSDYDTGYTIEIVARKNSSQPLIKISAPKAELNENISVNR
ncbi:MAG TPA: hypothetical protein VLG67_03695 [Candidatus Saccharimonadales bacterium]|nr:hypothetical protein [Candidatus Saccharimonadales bacterium]